MTAVLSVVLLGSFSAAYQPASAVTTLIFDDFTVPAGGAAFSTAATGPSGAFSNTNVSSDFTIDRDISVNLSIGDVDLQLNVGSDGLLEAGSSSTSGYNVFLDYSGPSDSTIDIDLTGIESFDLFFTLNDYSSLTVDLNMFDISSNAINCTAQSVPQSGSPSSVSFNLATDCTISGSFVADQVDSMNFGFFNADGIGSFQLDEIQATEFGISSTPIGGHSIPINTTALLLAGAQSISLWMIPVVVAGVVIGVFVIKRRK